MKLLAQHEVQHFGLPEPQAQTDHAERARQPDHAKLIDEIRIPLIMMMIVPMSVAMVVRVVMGMTVVMMRVGVIGHRSHCSRCQGSTANVFFAYVQTVPAGSSRSVRRAEPRKRPGYVVAAERGAGIFGTNSLSATCAWKAREEQPSRFAQPAAARDG